MLERPTRLIVPVLLAVVAGILIISSVTGRPGAVADVLAMTGVVLAVTALITVCDWILRRLATHQRQIADLHTQTAQVRIMEIVSRMTPEQIAYANSLQFVIKLLPGEPAPVVYALQIGDISVPIDFVRYFVSLSDDRYLPPIRQWMDGSLNRQYAVYLTNHLISLGYAAAASGNQAATWIDKARALQSMGLVRPDDSVNELVTIDYLSRLTARREREQRHAGLRNGA